MPTYPAWPWLSPAGVLVVVVAMLLSADADSVHWVGYVLGSFLTPLAVLLFREMDQRRRGSRYIPSDFIGPVAAALVVAGIGLATIHVFLALQEATPK